MLAQILINKCQMLDLFSKGYKLLANVIEVEYIDKIFGQKAIELG